VTEDDARLLAALVEQAAHPEAHADATARRTSDEWEVVLLWDQGPSSFGTTLTETESPWSGGSPDLIGRLDRLALDVSMFLIDESHGPHGDQDTEGRYWLSVAAPQ
jgi:hypothetical protein